LAGNVRARRVYQTSFCGADKELAADEEQPTGGEETAVVEPCVVRAFADVVDREVW
jgi:hypothetical protein